MARDASGNWIPLAPVVGGTVITSTWANNMMTSFGADVTESLDRSGRGGMLVPFRIADGTKLEPGYSWTAELSTGFYRDLGGFDMRTSVGGVDIFRWNANGAQISPDDGVTWNAVLTDGGGGTQVPVNIGTAEGQTLYWDNTTDFVWKPTNFLLTDVANGQILVTASSNGRAYSTAASTLGVFERNGDAGLSILAGTVTFSAINFGDTDSEVAGRVVYDHLLDSMNFLVNTGTTAMTIDATGNLDVTGNFSSLGIDDNALSTTLTLNNSGDAGIGGINAYGAGVIGFTIDATTEPVLDFNVAGTRTGSIAASATSFDLFTITNIPMTFNVNTSVEAMRIDTGGQLGIGTGATVNALMNTDAGDDVIQWAMQGTQGAARGLQCSLTGAYLSSPAQTVAVYEAPHTRGGHRFDIEATPAYFIGPDVAVDGRIAHIWDVSDGTTDKEGMRLTSTGLVGIGTTGPQTLLHVFNPAAGGDNEILRLSTNGVADAGSGSKIVFANQANTSLGYVKSNVESSTSVGMTFGVWNNTDGLTERLRIDGAGNVTVASGSIIATIGNFVGSGGTAIDPTYTFSGGSTAGMYSPAVNEWAVTTNSNERMRITAAGNVQINNTTHPEQLSVTETASGNSNVRFEHTAASNPNGVYCKWTAAAPNNTVSFFFRGDDSGGQKYAIWADGTTTPASDSRLKENIVSIVNGIDTIKALRPVTFDWIARTDATGTGKLGFIAQEVGEVLPTAVVISDDDFETQLLDKTAIIAPLVAAVQELTARLEALEGA